MKQTLKLFLLILSVTGQLSGVSAVYNLRISQTTRRQTLQKLKPTIAALTLFDQYGKRRNGIKQHDTGILTTFIYSPKAWYVRADWAVGNASARGDNVCTSRTQTDDLLLMAGHGYAINEQTNITWSGLLGIPTHHDDSLQVFQFGTGHVGAGFQLDGSYLYTQSDARTHAIMGAARLVHFFSRPVQLTLKGITKKYDFALGNLADLMIAHRSVWNKKNAFEFGYDLTYAFDAILCPRIPIIESAISFWRNSFYGSYLHGFSIKEHPSAIIVGLSYGFDSKPRDVGLSSIITVWATWGIDF